MKLRRVLTKMLITMKRDKNFLKNPENAKLFDALLFRLGVHFMRKDIILEYRKLCNKKLAEIDPSKKIDFSQSKNLGKDMELARESGLPDFFEFTTKFFIDFMDVNNYKQDLNLPEMDVLEKEGLPKIGKHETDSAGDITFISEYLHKHAYSYKNIYKVDKDISNEFSDNVIENYTYSKEEEDEVKKGYEKLGENNAYSNLKNSIKVDNPSNEIKKMSLSLEAKNKFLDSFKLAKDYLNTLPANSNSSDVNFKNEREEINEFITNLSS
nr:hypothetical protein [Acholeplasmatales bacterium]